MNTKAKIWLGIALVICVCTTVMNAFMGRLTSSAVALISIFGLCLLLFKEKKSGFDLMCIGYVLSFLAGVISSVNGGTSLVLSVIMSLIGSSLIPGLTALFLKGQWAVLK